jgi:hypothetical protein
MIQREVIYRGLAMCRISSKMILSLFLLFVLASTLALGWGGQVAGHPDTAGWKSLFATDLSDAVLKPGSWECKDGLLVAKSGETIWTRESYGDFVLDLEFKVSKEANSGIFLRTGDVNNILSALEIQIHETTDGAQYGMVGALYNAKPPSRDVTRPAGEWNHYTIACKGSRLDLIFNGERVLDLDLGDWKEPNKNPDGTRNKFPVALKDYARKGPIGLQGLHGKEAAPVWFRSLKIKVME